MTEKVEVVTKEEIQQIKDAKNKAVLVTAQAERAVALARVAELETNNIILSIYNKYGLKVGVDNIMENGQIAKAETAKAETPDAEPPTAEAEAEAEAEQEQR